MNRIMKSAAAVTLAGALAASVIAPSEARISRGGAAAIGFGAGALVGAAAANAAHQNYYYGPGYAYAPAPTYSYGPGYGAYAYAPAPVYAAEPEYGYYSGSGPGCETKGKYPYSTDASFCGGD
jgi:hypothetical protein